MVDLPEIAPKHWDTPAGREMAESFAKLDRRGLGMPDLSDFALANAQFMVDRNDLHLTAYQTAAKYRIRWLSVQLLIALRTLDALVVESGGRCIPNSNLDIVRQRAIEVVRRGFE